MTKLKFLKLLLVNVTKLKFLKLLLVNVTKLKLHSQMSNIILIWSLVNKVNKNFYGIVKMNNQSLIDSFDLTKGSLISIKINEETKGEWDIKEDDMRKMKEINGNLITKRLDKTLQNKISKIINYTKTFIKTLKTELATHIDEVNDEYINSVILFVITPHTVQEMPTNDVFDGLNKPKDIVQLFKSDGLSFLPISDSNIRAGCRHVMLSVMGNNGKMKTYKKFMELLLHELAHTMCNHVTFRRKGNHLEDFHNNEKFLTYFVNNCPSMKKCCSILSKLF